LHRCGIGEGATLKGAFPLWKESLGKNSIKIITILKQSFSNHSLASTTVYMIMISAPSNLGRFGANAIGKIRYTAKQEYPP
jgi:hypothetical protein